MAALALYASGARPPASPCCSCLSPLFHWTAMMLLPLLVVMMTPGSGPGGSSYRWCVGRPGDGRRVADDPLSCGANRPASAAGRRCALPRRADSPWPSSTPLPAFMAPPPIWTGWKERKRLLGFPRRARELVRTPGHAGLRHGRGPDDGYFAIPLQMMVFARAAMLVAPGPRRACGAIGHRRTFPDIVSRPGSP